MEVFLKSLLLATFIMMGIVSNVHAADLDGSYQMQSWTCMDGSSPFSNDVVTRIVSSTFLKISGNKIISTLKFDKGCEVHWMAPFTLIADELTISEMTGSASPACHDHPQEKEPAITFSIIVSNDMITFYHAPTPTETCSSGSVRVYKKIIPNKKN